MNVAINVTAEDIANGVAGDCHRCAVSLALVRATGDTGANVHERDWTMYIEVWGRVVPPPREVVEFIYEFDGLMRDEDGRPIEDPERAALLAPFHFALPDPSDPAWEMWCEGPCGCLVSPSHLDDRGHCPECRADAMTPPDDGDEPG